MGDLVERRIFHIVAAPTTYQNKQIGFDGSADADLGFKMVCGKDDVGAITKMLAKDKPARVQSFRILNGQFSWNFDETGDVGTLSVADSVTSLGKLEFSDDLLSTGGIKARFADNATEASDFLSDFGDMSIMGAMSWLKDNPISGLNEDQLVFGKADGTIDQSAALKFDDTDLLIRYSPTADPEKFIGINWQQIYGGDTISIGGSVQRAIALGNSLTLNGDMDDSLVLGDGTVDADGSLIAGDGLRIGQGDSPHSSAFADTLLAVGDGLTLDASSGFFIGNTINAESHYSSAVGTNIKVSHDYATARGKYVTTVAKGACHYGMDRYNSVDGTAEGFDGLILVGESTGDETVTLHDRFAGSDTSINLPDGIMGMFEIEVISAVYGADSTDNGYRIYTRRIIAWNNAGFGPWRFETANQTEIAASNATWSAAISATGDGSGNFNVQIVVSGTTGSPTITHVAKVGGLLSQTSLTASS